MTVTNGDGRGADEVSSYEVYLNGESVLPPAGKRNAAVATKIIQHDEIKVTLTGKPNSKVFVLITYDPRESK